MKTNYVTVYQCIAGWKMLHMWYNQDTPGNEFWEPWDTGMFAFATKEEAIEDAKAYAKENNLDYY